MLGGELGKLGADLIQCQPNVLREHDKRDATQHRARIATVTRPGPPRGDKAPLLVVAQRRGRNPASPRDLPNGQHRLHSPKEITNGP